MKLMYVFGVQSGMYDIEYNISSVSGSILLGLFEEQFKRIPFRNGLWGKLVSGAF